MTQTHRFGKRIPLPSTVQILHELKVLSGQEDAKRQFAIKLGLSETAMWDEIHRPRTPN
jgi:hypothetical protein